MLGHGWLFTNLPAEHRMNVFLTAVQAGDYAKAYGIFYNDANWQQHPAQYKDYPLQRFTEDFTTESEWGGPIKTFHVDFSRRNATGTVVEATINGKGGSDDEYSAVGWDAVVLSVCADAGDLKGSKAGVCRKKWVSDCGVPE